MITNTQRVTVQLLDDKSMLAILKGVIKALRQANRKEDAEEFQHEVTSGRPFMDVVNEYAQIE